MSNYQEGGTYSEGAPAGGQPYQEPTHGGSSAVPGPGQGGASQYDTSQYAGGGGQPGYQGQGYQGQGYQDQGHPGHQGLFQGANPLSSSRGRSKQIRSTFKTTEFWVLIVVSLALLIAAAVTDQGNDNQSFGAHDAWKFVTWLSIAYIVSRGLTKFAGHERDDDTHGRDRR
jgi:hypothetical protein